MDLESSPTELSVQAEFPLPIRPDYRLFIYPTNEVY